MKNSSLEKSVGRIEAEVGKHTVILEKHSKDISTLKGDVATLKGDVADLKRQTSRIGMEVVKHTEAIAQLATKAELDDRFNTLMSHQDKVMGILVRLDQERVFTREAIRRLEVADERHDKEIRKINEILKV